MSATRVVIVGGGPGGYEAALVAAQLGADVTVVERTGMGGSTVLTDVVPSKTLVATAEVMEAVAGSAALGVRVGTSGDPASVVTVDLARVNARVRGLAAKQSEDIGARLAREGIRVLAGTGRLDGASRVVVDTSATPDALEDHDGEAGAGRSHADEVLDADVVLLSTGSSPRTLPDAQPDGERILTWKQLYGLTELPERLIVVGSGVTGAEFANAYDALGAEVVLVSSRDRVLPGQDADAAEVIEEVFRRRGMEVLSRSRAVSARRTADGVEVGLEDGRVLTGSHCLMAVGSVPHTAGLGLEEAGVTLSESGHVQVDRVSRTTARGVYAAGDCTGVFALASVAAMQGRTAMWHALGDAVSPLKLKQVSATIFTTPEIATVGITQEQIEAGDEPGDVLKLPLATNPRAKMLGITDGFVKIFSRPGSGAVVGGVVVAPRASELIFPLTLAVKQRLTVDQVAESFTVYPSLSGSVAEAARQLHEVVPS